MAIINGTTGDDLNLIGTVADDTIDGGAGNDTMTGGLGDDVYYIDAADTVVELLGEGFDQVYSTVTYTLDANVEKVTLNGSSNINATGNDLDNYISGAISGGANILTGGLGNDYYYIADGDTIIEVAGEGVRDRAYYYGTVNTYTLADNVEWLLLGNIYGTANANGNLLNNRIWGNGNANTIDGAAGADILYGMAGNDLLIGGAGNDVLNGGTGDDQLTGGAGNDKYYVDSTADVVSETAGEGKDFIFTTVDFTIANNVEFLTLSGASAINGTGSKQSDTIIGNTAANILIGGAGHDRLFGSGGNDVLYGGSGNDKLYGGAGNDKLLGHAGSNTLTGGKGNDLYFVTSATDTVVENSGEGTDRVFATRSHTLADNIEILFLKGAVIAGTGNAQNNIIIGNTAANNLYGLGGHDVLYGGGGNDKLVGGDGNDRLYGQAGTNTLMGLDGNDRYYVDNSKDVIVEHGGGSSGIDLVYSSVSYRLADNVENLVLTGAADINGIGNVEANILTGNSGANMLRTGYRSDTLYGMGGNDTLNGGGGADQLYGGAGMDIFVYESLGALGDVIHDFDIGAGEYLKVGSMLAKLGWVGTDAVGEGWLSLVQSGGDVLVMVDKDGGGDALNTTLATITNDTTANLGLNWWLA